MANDTKQLAFSAAQIDAILAATARCSNRNLLDNWDFRNPVNQRGQSNYANSYCVDRWFLAAGVSTCTVHNGYIHILNYLVQTFEGNPGIQNGTHTFSILYRDGTILSCVIVPDQYVNVGAFSANYVSAEKRLYLLGEADIQAVKLELGSVSTLVNDPPADYGEELRKCKRYYRLWTTEAARTEALKEVGLMRTAPALSAVTIGGTTYYAASADL